MIGKYTRPLLLLYGLVNAALYSSLLPLWEGFDEEFHYGYVQYLEAHARFPVLGQTGLSQEINQSIGLLPMSYVMIENLHLRGVRTFDQYFALQPGQRSELYAQALRIPSALRNHESTEYCQNYEVHHAPLAYLLMAVPDSLLRRLPLPHRVWLLRLLVSFACVLLMFGGTFALAREAGLDGTYSVFLLFLIFSCQMFWAAIAHIDNDWLAVPLAVWLIVWALRCHRQPSTRDTVWLGIIMGLGLLSKAYFLVFVPLLLLAAIVWYRQGRLRPNGLALLLAIPLLLSGPWYARNLLLYGNLSGRLEESEGVTVAAALRSLASIPWLKSFPFMARGAFWMGNSSFTDFSVRTMDTLLALLAIALILYAGTYAGTAARQRPRSAEVFLWAPVLLFCAAMIYVTGSSYAFTKGLATAASPWYLQAVMIPLLAVAMLGCQRAGRVGRWVAILSVVLWGYILAATYVAKLFPLYGGFGGGRSTLRDIFHWYFTDWPHAAGILSTTAMVPAAFLMTLLVLLLATLLATLAATLDSHRSS